MKSTIFGSIFAGLFLFYVVWVLWHGDDFERINAACYPVALIGKPITSTTKLFSVESSRKVTRFFKNREQDCRFIVYDMFYAESEKAVEKK